MDSSAEAHGAFEVKDVLVQSWHIAKKYWIQFLALAAITFGVLIVVAIATGIVGVILAIIFSRAPAILGLWQLISMLIRYVVLVPILIAIIRLSFIAVDGGVVDYKKLFEHKDAMMALFIAGAIILSGILISVGLLFFVIPGIFAAVVFGFAMYVVTDKGMNPVEALQVSYALTENNRLNVFLLMLANALIALIAFLPIMVLGGGSFILLAMGSGDGDLAQVMVPLAGIMGILAVTVGGAIALVGGFIASLIKQISMAKAYRMLAAKNHAAFNVAKTA